MFFLHIPKTGGTSLIAYLEQHYATEHILPVHFFGSAAEYVTVEGATRQIAEARQRPLVHGHYSYHMWQKLFADFTPLTLLRDPRTRIVSCYIDWQTKSAENLAAAPEEERELAKLASDLSLSDLLKQDHPMVRRWFIDAQARQLAAVADDAPSGRTMRNDAMDHLRSIELVGVTELLDAFVSLLACRFGWTPPEHAPRLNQAADRNAGVSLSPDDLAAIDHATRLDRELHALAQERFARLLSNQLNEDSSQPDQESQSDTLAFGESVVELDMSMPIRGRGWHEREGGGREPIWRWTGPERQSTIELPLDPHKAWQVEFHIISYIEEAVLEGTHVVVGGRSLDIERIMNDNDRLILKVMVKPEFVSRTGHSPISILVPKTRSHAELDASCSDRRQKGLAITAIRAVAMES